MVFKFRSTIKGLIVYTACTISACYAGTKTPNSMPSCSAYSDIMTCNASKNAKGKGAPCMFLLPNNDRGYSRSDHIMCTATNDTETVNFFKRINIKEIAEIYPDLYEHDTQSKIGNPNSPSFNNQKRYTMIGNMSGGYISSSLNLKSFYDLCVASKNEDDCKRMVFDRNIDFMFRAVQLEDIDWSSEDEKGIEWDALDEETRSNIVSAELERNEGEITRILLQIKSDKKAKKKAAGGAAAEERKNKRKRALETEKENGKAAEYDDTCRQNTSGESCRRAFINRGNNNLLENISCAWTHSDGWMGGGECRYVNAISCGDLIQKDCSDSSATLTEVNSALGQAGMRLECTLEGRTCAVR